VVVGHVGDSRAYLLRDRKLAALTHDHTVAQELVDVGEYTPERAKSQHRQEHAAAALGDLHVQPDVVEQTLRPGDRLLLCSDGLHGAIPERSMRRVLARRGPPEQIAHSLVALALKARAATTSRRWWSPWTFAEMGNIGARTPFERRSAGSGTRRCAAISTATGTAPSSPRTGLLEAVLGAQSLETTRRPSGVTAHARPNRRGLEPGSLTAPVAEPPQGRSEPAGGGRHVPGGRRQADAGEHCARFVDGPLAPARIQVSAIPHARQRENAVERHHVAQREAVPGAPRRGVVGCAERLYC
jgi:hypothetical protein